MKVSYSIMINLLGTSSDMQDLLKPCAIAMGLSNATVHLYGKPQVRIGRKMGHITLVGNNVEELKTSANQILSAIPKGSESEENSATKALTARPVVGIIMGSDSDLPTMKPAAIILKEFGVPFELTIVSAHRTPLRMVEYAKRAHQRGIQVIIAAAGN